MDCNTPLVPDNDGVYPALGEGWKQCLLTRDKDGRPFRWRDPDRIVHATVEWPLEPAHPESIGVTRCGVYDIPIGESWTGTEALTCRTCAALEHEDKVS